MRLLTGEFFERLKFLTYEFIGGLRLLEGESKKQVFKFNLKFFLIKNKKQELLGHHFFWIRLLLEKNLGFLACLFQK